MCESNGDPQAINHNKNGTYDIGFFQINSIWHKKFKNLGFDVNDPIDNLEIGFYMLKNYGTSPWKYSKYCWDDSSVLKIQDYAFIAELIDKNSAISNMRSIYQ